LHQAQVSGAALCPAATARLLLEIGYAPGSGKASSLFLIASVEDACLRGTTGAATRIIFANGVPADADAAKQNNMGCFAALAGDGDRG
jgi:hypothetical protein